MRPGKFTIPTSMIETNVNWEWVDDNMLKFTHKNGFTEIQEIDDKTLKSKINEISITCPDILKVNPLNIDGSISDENLSAPKNSDRNRIGLLSFLTLGSGVLICLLASNYNNLPKEIDIGVKILACPIIYGAFSKAWNYKIKTETDIVKILNTKY